jgi:hypothetical protein
MERTRGGPETVFLHLELARDDIAPGARLQRNVPRDLLITDLSGETFRLARDNVVEAARLSVLHRTDRLAVLVDGAKLASPATRQAAARYAFSHLGSLIDAEMVDRHTAVDLVVTKWDLIEDGERPDDAKAFLVGLERRARAYAGHVAELHWHQTAALPTRACVPLGFGMDTLVRAWMENSFILPTPTRRICRPNAAGTSEYARFSERHFGRTSRNRDITGGGQR